MNSEIVIKKIKKCLLQRNGVEIWLDENKAIKLSEYLETNPTDRFIKIEGQTVNIADITGIYDEQFMLDLTRKKNGDYICNKGNWHTKGETCMCRPQEDRTREKYLVEKIKTFFEENPDEKEIYRKMDEDQRLKYKLKLFGDEAANISITIKDIPKIQQIAYAPAPKDY